MTALAAAIFLLGAGLSAAIAWATIRREYSAVKALRHAVARCPAVMEVRIAVIEQTPHTARATAACPAHNVVITGAFGAAPAVSSRSCAPQPAPTMQLAA